MIERYASEQMTRIWSDENRFRLWLEVETTVCEVRAELGQIPAAAALAIRERGGYTLMPEANTKPANHYLPRRKTTVTVRSDELYRSDNPHKIDGAPFDKNLPPTTEELN